MKRFLILLIIIIPVSQAYSVKTLLILGDSLSTGYGIQNDQSWVSILKSNIRDMGLKITIINASVSGNTSSNGLDLLNTYLKQKPDIILIILGGNDGLRGLPIHTIKNNLSAIIAQAKKLKAFVILAGVRLPPNYGEEYTNQFQSIYLELAKEYNIPLIDNILKDIDDQPDLMQQDGIHPNTKAQIILFKNVWPHLENQLK